MCHFAGTPIKAVHEIAEGDDPIIAYKVLLPINSDGTGAFTGDKIVGYRSPLQTTRWSDKQLHSPRLPGRTRASAHGIYAFRTKKAAEEYRTSQCGAWCRVVKVALSGRVVEHEYVLSRGVLEYASGYRAEKAKILRLMPLAN